MSYPTYTNAVLCYIEAHIKEEKLNHKELEKQIGFCFAHIRDLFCKNTGYPLIRYVRMRKVKCSAMELIHTEKSILEIAQEYGFLNPETYTRAFYKIVGVTPSQFRKQRFLVGKEELSLGVYGVGLLEKKEQRSDMMMEKNVYQNNGSTILYGVPKVFWGAYGGGTPYPICLKACSEYLGEDINYNFTMVSSAAAFRFVWNNTNWDLSNIDIFHTFEENNTIYKIGAKALGREFSFLGREKNTTKEEFISFIKQHIDEGYPCIALGIIGPPEPCIITGYRNHGETLLGWNFFQNDPEFSNDIEVDESGYFISKHWWENTDTQAVMCMGAIAEEKLSLEQIMINAVKALSGRIDCGYSKGIKAYDAWKKALEEEKSNTADENYSLLFEKMLCQRDAMSCLIDGRNCAASFFKEQAIIPSSQSKNYQIISDYFLKCAKTIEQMWSLYETPEEKGTMDGMLKRLSDPEIRKKTCDLIEIAKCADTKALEKIKQLNELM